MVRRRSPLAAGRRDDQYRQRRERLAVIRGGGAAHLALPVLALVMLEAGSLTRYVRASMLDAVNGFYLYRPRQGLQERTVILKLRNALLPIITLLGFELPGLFSGAIITEKVFNWPGAGHIHIDSLAARDYPVLMGFTLFLAVLTIVGNLLADVLYAWAYSYSVKVMMIRSTSLPSPPAAGGYPGAGAHYPLSRARGGDSCAKPAGHVLLDPAGGDGGVVRAGARLVAVECDDAHPRPEHNAGPGRNTVGDRFPRSRCLHPPAAGRAHLADYRPADHGDVGVPRLPARRPLGLRRRVNRQTDHARGRPGDDYPRVTAIDRRRGDAF